MPFLGSLETEILAQILQNVDDESPRTTKRSVLFVNKHFYATAQLVAHRRKRVDCCGKAVQTQIQTWLEDPLILRNIREITVTGRASSWKGDPLTDRGSQLWACLVELVKKAGRLTKFHFDYGLAEFPHAVLDALQTYHPNVKLYIWSYYRAEGLNHGDEGEQALKVSPLLRLIRATIWTDGIGSDMDLRLAAFQRIVANAPNLESASVVQGHSGCLVGSYSPAQLAREKRAAAKFFSASQRPNSSIRSLTLDGFGMDKNTLEEWGKYVSLPHLESLQCSRGMPGKSYFEVAPKLLTNLKHVSLNLSTASHAPEFGSLVDNYLAMCAPLATLSLWGWMGLVSFDTILKHGPTLRRLQLHERETLSLDMRRGLLSVEDIRRIRAECPLLNDFTFDMDREAKEWQKDLDRHEEMLEELAQFGSRLRKLQIYLDLGVATKISGLGRQAPFAPQPERPQTDDEEADDDSETCADEDYRGPFPPPKDPDDIKKHAERAWKQVFGHPMQMGPRELHIKWGEVERKTSMGYPAGWVIWEREHVKHVVAWPHERDDRPGEAFVQLLRGHVESRHS